MGPKVFERTIHSEGHTVICYSPDGRRIVTGGSDAFIRVFDARDEQKDPATLEHCNDNINSVTVTDHQIIVGTEDHFAIAFNAKTLQFEKNLIRRTMPIRQVAINREKSLVAVALDELEVRVVDVEDPTQTSTLKGHSRQVLSVEFDPKGRYLASASCDGSVKIWESRDFDWVCKTTLDLIPQISDIEPEILLRLSWHPEGTHLAVSGASGVKILERDSWAEASTLVDKESSSQPISMTMFSPNGLYMAAADLAGSLFVWQFPSGNLLHKFTNKSRITGLAWDPIGNALATVDNLGWLTVRHDIISLSSKLSHPAEKTSAKIADELRASLGLDDANPSAQGEEKARKRLGKKSLAALVDEESDAEGTAAMHEEVIPDELEGPGEDLDDFIVDDERNEFTSAPLVAQMQKAFQPGSTPVEQKRRFLVWNYVGSIISRDEQIHRSVDIEFHDKAQHRPVHFTDHYSFTMAALNDRAAVFASLEQKNKVPSTIFFRPFESWASNGEWTQTFDAGEEARAIALGSSWIAVATSSNYLRIFSFAGLPLLVTSLAGDVVCIAGHENLLFIIYHTGAPINGEQCLGYTLTDVPTKKIVTSGKLPLSKGARVSWAGFSESGMPGVSDSAGILRGLALQWSSQWIPLHQTSLVRKDKKEHYWVVGFSDTDLSCIFTKGAEKFPQIFPRPVISCLPLRMPLLQPESQASVTEDGYLRNEIVLAHNQWEWSLSPEEDHEDELVEFQKQSDRHLLTMLQAACKTDKTMKALEIFSLLSLPKSQDAALMIASKFNLSALVDRMTLLHQAKAAERSRKLLAESYVERAAPYKSALSSSLEDHRPASPKPVLYAPKPQEKTLSSSLSFTSSFDRGDEDSDPEVVENPFAKKKVAPVPKVNPFTKKASLDGQKRSMSSSDSVGTEVNADEGPKSKKSKTAPAATEKEKAPAKPRGKGAKGAKEKEKEKEDDDKGMEVDNAASNNVAESSSTAAQQPPPPKKTQQTLAAFSFAKKKDATTESSAE